jgi:hypothetical protein
VQDLTKPAIAAAPTPHGEEEVDCKELATIFVYVYILRLILK